LASETTTRLIGSNTDYDNLKQRLRSDRVLTTRLIGSNTDYDNLKQRLRSDRVLTTRLIGSNTDYDNLKQRLRSDRVLTTRLIGSNTITTARNPPMIDTPRSLPIDLRSTFEVRRLVAAFTN